MADNDDLEEWVIGKMGELELDQLKFIHNNLQLPAIDPDKDNKRHVMKLILRYLSSEDVEDSDDGGMAHFLAIQTYLDSLGIVKCEPPPPVPINTVTTAVATTAVPPGVPVTAVSVPNVVVSVPVVSTLPPVLSTVVGVSLGSGGISSVPTQPAVTTVTSTVVSPITTSVLTPQTLKKVLKKDFKIRGTIGAVGKPGMITFLSLACQINTAVRKEYPEVDICEEVIRSMSPDLPLRSVLEGKEVVSLASLRRFLRSHFREKDPTSLFNSLSNSCQMSTESASDFVMKMIGLRIKVLFVTKEVDSRVQYTDKLVQDQFVRTIMNGLRCDTIRSEIKGVLMQDVPSDEELIEVLNRVESDENERQSRLKESKKKEGNIKKIDTTQGADSATEEPKSSKKDHNPILAKLEEMQKNFEVKLNEVSALKGEVAGLKKQVNQKRQFGCRKCVAAGTNRRCNHCFKCCKPGHKRGDPACTEEEEAENE